MSHDGARRWYRRLLNLAPRRLRERHGADMETLFAERLSEARGGCVAIATIWARATLDLISAIVHEPRRRRARRGRVGIAHERPAMIGSDIRYALRALTRQKLSSALVIGMLATGIAANVAVFSLVNGLFLRPFPFPEPDRLVFVNEKAPRWNLDMTGINFPDFDRWRQDQSAFEALALWDLDFVAMAEHASAERIPGLRTTYEMTQVMRISPLLGRMFTAEEDKPGARDVALLGARLWRERFGADPAVLGRMLRLNGKPYEVIGVLPPEADAYPGEARVWLPLKGNPAQTGQNYSYMGLGRLRDGFTAALAEQDLVRAHQPIWDTSDKERVVSPFVVPLREVLVRDYRSAASTIMGAVALLLLVACANVAAVMLARGLARRREMAVRAAVGASRSRLLRQLLIENLVLALAGGAIGLLLGEWATAAFVSALPDQAPPWASFAVDARVMLFALATSVLTVLIFGWAPALHALTSDLRSAMHNVANAPAASPGGRRTLVALVGTEFALATLLVICGGLLLRAYDRVQHVDPGFSPDGVFTFRMSLPSATYPDNAARFAFWKRLEARLQALPGVSAAGLGNCPPMSGCHWGMLFEAENEPARRPADPNPVVLFRVVTPSYFSAIGVRLTRGRLFDDRDLERGPGETSAIVVNETFARTFFPNDSDPLGRRVRTDPKAPWRTVVGIVGDIRHYGLEQPARPGVYVPLSTQPVSTFSGILRTDGSPEALAGSVRAVVQELDPELPLFRAETMAQAMRGTMAVRSAYSWMLATFAGMGLALALAGTYGVSSYLVTQRTREMGIRLALGACRTDIMRAVLRHSLTTVAGGIIVGVAAALGVARFLSSLLFGVAPYDAVILSSAVVLLSSTALAANLLPARRAARVDPVSSLRSE